MLGKVVNKRFQKRETIYDFCHHTLDLLSPKEGIKKTFAIRPLGHQASDPRPFLFLHMTSISDHWICKVRSDGVMSKRLRGLRIGCVILQIDDLVKAVNNPQCLRQCFFLLQNTFPPETLTPTQTHPKPQQDPMIQSKKCACANNCTFFACIAVCLAASSVSFSQEIIIVLMFFIHFVFFYIVFRHKR